MTNPPATDSTVGVILAGGLSRRMGGGDKTLHDLNGAPILSHVIRRATGQVGTLLLNVNGDASRLADTVATDRLPIIPDVIEGFAGPLAGVLTGMAWVREHAPNTRWLISFAADAPFFPLDMTVRLCTACIAQGADSACAQSGGRSHPVFALWSVHLYDDLHHAMTQENIRKIDAWTARHGHVHVSFDDTPYDAFFNINTPEDLAQARHIAEAYHP